MTRDPEIEAADIVRLVRMADAATAIKLVKTQLERFFILGEQSVLEQFRDRMLTPTKERVS